MYIERAERRTRAIPMTPLVDVVFLLLIFFMLSTSFVRTESLELIVPSAGSAVPVAKVKLLQVYVTGDGYMYLGRKPVNEEALVKSLKVTVSQHPDVNILLLSGPKVNVQQLVKMMDRINLAGGKNVSIASWRPASASSNMVNEQAEGEK